VHLTADAVEGEVEGVKGGGPLQGGDLAQVVGAQEEHLQGRVVRLGVVDCGW